MIDLVLSRFNEHLEWLRSWDPNADLHLRVYNKGDGGALLNVGREAHTYFWHIIKHYDDLADWTFFSQGNPIPHCHKFYEIVTAWPDSYLKSALYVSPDQMHFSDHPVMFIEADPKGDDAANDCRGLWNELFAGDIDDYPVSAPGAIFAITRERLLTRSLDFYQRALELSVSRPRGPWEFERLWAYLWTSSAATKL